MNTFTASILSVIVLGTFILVQASPIKAAEGGNWQDQCQILQDVMSDRGNFLEDGYLESQRMANGTIDHLEKAIDRFSTNANVSTLEADLANVEAVLNVLESDYAAAAAQIAVVVNLDCATVASVDFSAIGQQAGALVATVIGDIRLIQEYHFTAQIHIQEVEAAASAR